MFINGYSTKWNATIKLAVYKYDGFRWIIDVYFLTKILTDVDCSWETTVIDWWYITGYNSGKCTFFINIYIQTLDLECNILILWTENLLRNLLYVPLFKSFRTIGFYRMVCQVVTFFGPQRMFLCILLWYIMMELVNQIATHSEHGLNNNNANYKFWN